MESCAEGCIIEGLEVMSYLDVVFRENKELLSFPAGAIGFRSTGRDVRESEESTNDGG